MAKVEIPNWLERLPLAPVFRPTDTEFADPIAYISKIEKEASAFGICKIIPPLPRPSKKYVFSNLNKSLSKCPDVGPDASLPRLGTKMGHGDCSKEGEVRGVFTTRQQELGQSAKRTKGAVNNTQVLGGHKQVWQSGEVYTLEQFEAKSKAFARTWLGMMKEVSPLAIEAMFWKAAKEKPIYVEYANDVPGSAFGEPEGQLRHLRRRRRTRTRGSYQRMSGKDEAGDVKDPCSSDSCEKKVTHPRSTTCSSLVTCFQSSSPSEAPLLDQSSKVHRKINSSSSCSNSETEGSAGWKLSNSPWNLQAIARSPGSLTRFMPDDIPGVTSPMIYIGMLFSWFAWHVEDHELHSMNYLHVGSPKTWYSVPGDYAFDFEEVIRANAYGGNTDQLAALSLLGEKTTVVSPEVIVASGIPCCRLVQNPGEFVVTFPRAYHIGFSHGFNCGEAANFATPQWLQFAREAAVRRAAMSYLPMLSHQQLLYLLTMSFISRIPISLLPGARSSRLRDRQREEREILVKKAFVEDMQNENHLLSSLLGKDSSYHAVVWNPNMLPSLGNQSVSPNGTTSVSTHPQENVDSSVELSLYMEAQNELDMENEDLFFDFQVDSGSLACVACGILGFPFMCVIQPSEAASLELPPKDVTLKAPPDISHVEPADVPVINLRAGWNSSSRFRRPRIFCLEHAIKVQGLLQSKGGANLLVICHSDYQKMKAYAAVIAEETSSNFDYKEIPLNSASPEDLNLIELGIIDDENDGIGEDWTSRLGINLRYCVRVKKNYPSKQVQYLLTLGELVSSKSISSSNAMGVEWKSRKSRTKPRSDVPQKCEPCKSIESSEGLLPKNIESNGVKDIIQYRRRKSKFDPHDSEKSSARELGNDNSNSACIGISAEVTEHEVQVLEASGQIGLGFPNRVTNLPASTSLFIGNVEVQVINQTSDGMDIDEEARSTSQVQDEEEESDNTRETNSSSPYEDENSADSEIQMENVRIIDEANEHIDSVKECQEAPTIPCAEKEEYCQYSPSLSNLQHEMEQIDDDPVTVEECSEASEEGTSDRHSSDVASSYNKLEREPRHDQESKGTNEVEISSSRRVIELGPSDPQSSTSNKKRKRKGEVDTIADDELFAIGFVKSPCEGLRPRARSGPHVTGPEGHEKDEKLRKKATGRRDMKSTSTITSGAHSCNLEGCRMRFKTKDELSMHRRNRCHHIDCGKKFRSHKYLILHQRVHEDDRPLKCPWKGCGMSFKWAWARTEHIRVHTGERPYKCKVSGCGLSFRFISDYNRHRRKTGHYVS